VTAANSLEGALRMLDAGRLDLVVTDLFSGRVAVKKMQLDARIQPLLPPLQRIEIFHHLHEQYRDLAGKVEAAIRDMEASGELAQLRERLVREMLEAKD